MAAKTIRTEADAVAWLKERGLYAGLDIVKKNDVSYAIFSAACWKCGGSGYGYWYPDGGRCYACGGAYTKDRTKSDEPTTKKITPDNLVEHVLQARNEAARQNGVKLNEETSAAASSSASASASEPPPPAGSDQQP